MSMRISSLKLNNALLHINRNHTLFRSIYFYHFHFPSRSSRNVSFRVRCIAVQPRYAMLFQFMEKATKGDVVVDGKESAIELENVHRGTEL